MACYQIRVEWKWSSTRAPLGYAFPFAVLYSMSSEDKYFGCVLPLLFLLSYTNCYHGIKTSHLVQNSSMVTFKCTFFFLSK